MERLLARKKSLFNLLRSYMKTSELGITDTSKNLVRDLLNGEQSLPNGTHFDNDIFVDAY
ncbi:hypothetical protein GGTG_13268 [Gaeumannomyces tritici R3-111a-1]|uniref:Uncharacterized protein n=1 Tax=Gaeumannomyces tritici (strain R3-111a-1) TaxID=644352 RepID=J3PIE0_GAET3|nr:hypothetical protein GGTG_13268 [Gaeumannomyces tritici R3-111a-1]EJT69159.1 hypothetical protein GGTG_13268 [Gaeumannomyces tritici R3-111a-1]